MQHLATCPVIYDHYWTKIHDLMSKLGIRNVKAEMFRLLGIRDKKSTVCKEGAAVLAIAWRCLYAETVRSRIQGSSPDWNKTLKRAVAMLIGRVTAYGEKWRLWYLKQRHHTRGKQIAKRFRKFKLIESDEYANYTISEQLLDFHKQLLDKDN